VEAGKRLAEALLDYMEKDVIVLAIPRGGVVVGYEVAHRLRASLDLIIPRKIGAPSDPELAIGAVSQDGTMVLNNELVSMLRIPENYIKKEADRQIREIERRMRNYRGEGKPLPALKGKTVILVDDGIATGATTRAAIQSIRKQKTAVLVVAVPVAPKDTIMTLKNEADRVVCLDTPESFQAIGQFYEDFRQISDEEVIQLLDKAGAK
jgi:predicted phosphoribosyltransferase